MNITKKLASELFDYQEKPDHQTCGKCKFFTSDFVIPSWVKTDYDRKMFESGACAKVEKNLRCTEHGFSTKKMATCKLWSAKE